MFPALHSRIGHYLLLVSLTAVLYLPGLGRPSLWDIDEGHNAEAAREMLERDNWIIPQFNYQLRVDKPVLLYWLQMLAYLAFGVNEFAARFPSALAALFSVLCTYELGRRLFDPATALLGGVILASSLLFCGSAHFANPDAILNACIVLTFLVFWQSYSRGGSGWLIGIGFTMGLGFLAKGPVAVVLPATAIGIYLLWSRELRTLWRWQLVVGMVAWALVALPWFALVGSETKGEFLEGFFLKHNKDRFLAPMEGHGGTVFYHVVSLFLGFLPWSVFLVPALWYAVKQLRGKTATGNAESPSPLYSGERGWGEGATVATASPSPPTPLPPVRGRGEIPGELASGDGKSPCRFLLCWIAVWIVFFSISRTKLPNYILPLYPAVALLTASFLTRWRRGEIVPRRWVMPVGLATLGVVGVGITAGLLVAGGVIEVPLDRRFPGLEHLAWIGAIPVIGAAVASWRLVATDREGAITGVAASATLLAATFAVQVAPAVDGFKAPRPLVAAAGARQLDRDIRIGCYEYYQPSLVFYCRREVTQLFDEGQARMFLQSPVPVYLIMPVEVWHRWEAKSPRGYATLARHWCFYRNCEVVVVTNH